MTDPDISKEKEKMRTFVHLIVSGGLSFISLVPVFFSGSMVDIVASKLNNSINDKLKDDYVKDDRHLRKPTKLDKSQLEGNEELIRILSSVEHSKEGCCQGSSEPKFLLIGTHAYKHRRLFDEMLSGENRWLKKSLGELRSICVEVSPDGEKNMEACSDSEVEIPTRWYVFELEMRVKAKKVSQGVLGRAECIEIGEKFDMEEEDIMAALVFLGGAALCLYFKAATAHLVFTDPQVILSEVTEILNLGIIDLHLIPSQYPLLSEHMAMVQRLRDQGLFNKKLVDIMCSNYRVNDKGYGKCSYTLDDFLVHFKVPLNELVEEYFFKKTLTLWVFLCKKIPNIMGLFYVL